RRYRCPPGPRRGGEGWCRPPLRLHDPIRHRSIQGGRGMSWWRAVWLVAQRELRERGRSKSYVFSTVFIIILLGGAFVVPALRAAAATRCQLGRVRAGGAEVVATAGATGLEGGGGAEPAEFGTVALDGLGSAAAALEDDDVDVVLVGGTELVTGPGGAL